MSHEPRELFKGFHDASMRPLRRLSPSAEARGIQVIQGEWEFNALLDIYEHHAPFRVLEVGSLFGGTMFHWIKKAVKGAMVVSVDRLVPEGDVRRREQADAREQWSTWAQKSGVGLMAFEGDSHDEDVIESARRHGPYDFVFIDGDHTYDGAKRDFVNYGGMTAPGAIIALHDIVRAPWWGSIEVWRLWEEIRAAGHLTRELYTASNQEFDPDKAGLGIGLVYV